MLDFFLLLSSGAQLSRGKDPKQLEMLWVPSWVRFEVKFVSGLQMFQETETGSSNEFWTKVGLMCWHFTSLRRFCIHQACITGNVISPSYCDLHAAGSCLGCNSASPIRGSSFPWFHKTTKHLILGGDILEIYLVKNCQDVSLVFLPEFQKSCPGQVWRHTTKIWF